MIIPKDTKILDDEEVQRLLEIMMAAMPASMKKMLVLGKINPEDSIRMRSLNAAFRNARETANETLRDTSKKTRIPQYRIRAVEKGNIAEIQPKFLRQLSLHFGLDKWCSRWATVNRKLASELGMLEWLTLGKKTKEKGVSAKDVSDIEKQVREFVESRRPPEQLRSKVDVAYRNKGQSFYIFEIRPRWDQPDIIQEIPVAKATYVKISQIWKLYWIRADSKWHRYDPLPDTPSLQIVLHEIGGDPHGCFWG